jgi:hypothetical protein
MLVETIDFAALRPIACAQDGISFIRNARRIYNESRNETTTEQVIGFLELLSDVPPLLDDCGIQVPSWLNDTV